MTVQIKAVAGEDMQTGQAIRVEVNDGEYVARRALTIGKVAATATEDIKVGDRLIFEGDFIRKAVGDEWSRLP